jgi:hypothetical protein
MSGHDHIEQQSDSIESGKIIAIGVSALAIFALGIVWAVQIQKDSLGSIHTVSQVPAGNVDEVGIVYQQSFDRDYGHRLLVETQARLDSVGWVDQAKNKVHIPIDRAIDDYLADEAKNGGKL